MSRGFGPEEDQDRVGAYRPVRGRERSWEELDLELRALTRTETAHDMVPVYAPKNLPRRLSSRAMLGATATWLAMVFGLCYVLLPAALAVSGINASILGSIPLALPAFAMGAMVVAVGAAVLRPAVRVGFGGPRDPVVSATVGGLGVWALIHNTSSLLEPFWGMSLGELAAFVGLNVLEMGLLGMMLASFTRSRAVALALGGGFQLLTMGLFLTLLGVAAL